MGNENLKKFYNFWKESGLEAVSVTFWATKSIWLMSYEKALPLSLLYDISTPSESHSFSKDTLSLCPSQLISPFPSHCYLGSSFTLKTVTELLLGIF